MFTTKHQKRELTLYFLQKSSMEPTSEPCTCLKAALYWTNNLEQEAVYLKQTKENTVKVKPGIFVSLFNKKYKLKYNLLIRCDTVLDVSLLQGLKGLDDSEQLCHVIIPSETGLIMRCKNTWWISGQWSVHVRLAIVDKGETYFSRSLAFLYSFTSWKNTIW